MSEQLIIDIRISADEYLKSYSGIARTVATRSRDGRRIRFPASILRPFVTRDGIEGSFIISFDEAQKFQEIRRLG